MYKSLLLSFLVFIASLPIFGQNITVVDQNMQPIEGVVVTDSLEVIGHSDKEGKVILPANSYPTRTFVFSHQSYHPKAMSFALIQRSGYRVMLYVQTGTLKGIDFSAGRVFRMRNNVALSVDHLSEQQITFAQSPTAADLLGDGFKVYIQKSQLGGGSPMIRGFATNRILIVVDDVRMNTAIFRSGNVQNILAIDPFSVHNSEVLFGPGSQFFGSDAIGGVINFHMKQAELSYSDSTLFVGNATARYASASQERSLHADFKVSGKRFGSFTSFSMTQFGNLRMGNDGPELYARPDEVVRFNGKDSVINNQDPSIQSPSDYSQLNFIQKFRFRPSEPWLWDYGFYYSTNPSTPRYDRLILRNKQDHLTYARWNYGPQSWLMNRLQVEHKTASKLYDHFKITAAHQWNEESREDRKFGEPRLRVRSEAVQALSFNWDLLKKLDQNMRLNYGLEYVFNRVSSEGITSAIIPDGSPDETIASRYPNASQWSAAGAYINFFCPFNALYKLEGGLRYNLFAIQGTLDTTFYPLSITDLTNRNGALTFSVAQTFKWGDNKLGLVTSSAFRAPNIDDIAKVFDSSPGTVIIPNPKLKPELAYNLELNFQTLLFKRLELQLASYYTYLDGAITRVNSDLSGSDSILYDGVLSQVQQLKNTDHAIVYGAQVQAIYRLNRFWNILSNFNWIYSSSPSGEPIRHITPHYGSTRLSFNKRSWQAAFYMRYHTEMTSDRFAASEINDAYLYVKDEAGLPYSPSWVTFNLKLQKQLNDRIQLHAAFENILDKRYRPYGSGISAAGRNFILAVSALF